MMSARPLYPYEPTFKALRRSSESGHNRTHAVQQEKLGKRLSAGGVVYLEGIEDRG
jgi:hypothetical protein